MKKLLLIFITFLCLLLASISYGQSSIGMGVGVISEQGMAVQLKIQNEWKQIGVTGGFITSPSPSSPCYFNSELFYKLGIDGSTRAIIHGGTAYRLLTNDRKQLNGFELMGGASIEFLMNPKNNIAGYFDFSITEKKTIILLIGIRGIL